MLGLNERPGDAEVVSIQDVLEVVAHCRKQRLNFATIDSLENGYAPQPQGKCYGLSHCVARKGMLEMK